MELKDWIQLGISGGGVVAMLAMHYQRLVALERTVSKIDTEKVDVSVYNLSISRLDRDVAAVSTRVEENHRRIDHRVRNLEQHQPSSYGRQGEAHRD